MARDARNLVGWLNEPYVQDAVIDALKRAEYALCLREVVIECDLAVSSANRALLRLHAKGLVSRYKLPMQRHIYCHRAKACQPFGAERMLYVYSWRR